ncbi:MAG: hypothetical protein K8S99_03175 [Planctomycetes bacterium]|nr:hypothetical protein [Planctomycetota bacterium]
MSEAAAKDSILLHTFRIDVTPPVGDYLCGGLHTTSIGVEQPIDLRGVVLTHNGVRHVLASLDFCYVCGRSNDRLIRAVADGAGTDVSRVVVPSNHLHDVPLIDEEPHAIVAELSPLNVHNESWWAALLGRVTAVLRETLASPGRAVTHVGISWAAVTDFASIRRVIDVNNRAHTRYSKCMDPTLKAAPDGPIDPLLRQVTLYCGEKNPAVCLHSYASHPQVSDGRRLVSGDTVGVARDLFAHSFPDVLEVYFSGCAGDVTAGKYTTARPQRDRLNFGVRLADAMHAAHLAAAPQPLRSLSWSDHTVTLPLAAVAPTEADLLRDLRDPAVPHNVKYLRAMKLDRLRRRLNEYPYRLTALRLNDIALLFLPAEPLIEYQHFTHARYGARLMVSGYGDSFLKYVATDHCFAQGGYEVDPWWTEIKPGAEAMIKAGIVRVMG